MSLRISIERVARYAAIGVSFAVLMGLVPLTNSARAGDAKTADPNIVALVPKDVQQRGTIMVASIGGAKPFSYFDTDGKTLIGINNDLTRAVGELMGLETKLVVMPFDAMLPSLAAGKNDMAVAMDDTKQREKVVDFVTFGRSGWKPFVLKGNPSHVDLTLCGFRVGAMRGSNYQSIVIPKLTAQCTDAGKQGIAESYFNDPNEGYLALRSQRIDALLSDLVPNMADYPEMASFEYVGDFVPSLNPMGAAFPKNSGLKEAVRAAMQELIKSGRYQEILDKYGLGFTAITPDKVVINGASF